MDLCLYLYICRMQCGVHLDEPNESKASQGSVTFKECCMWIRAEETWGVNNIGLYRNKLLGRQGEWIVIRLWHGPLKRRILKALLFMGETHLISSSCKRGLSGPIATKQRQNHRCELKLFSVWFHCRAPRDLKWRPTNTGLVRPYTLKSKSLFGHI